MILVDWWSSRFGYRLVMISVGLSGKRALAYHKGRRRVKLWYSTKLLRGKDSSRD